MALELIQPVEGDVRRPATRQVTPPVAARWSRYLALHIPITFNE